MSQQSSSSDDAYLREFGVEPRLKRVLGFFTGSLFAIAFQGPTTGALLITGATLAFGGPAFIWAIPLVFLFQFIVALNWAELSSHYPLTGGIYQWAKYLGGEVLGWFTGLFYLVAIILVMPAVGLVVSIVLSGLFPSVIKFTTTTQVVISLLAIVATAIIISTSVRLVALINSIGVVLELAVLVVVAFLLLFHHHQSLSVLGSTGGTASHSSYLWPFLVVVALVLTQIVGFETAGAFAEETRQSRIRPSQAILAGCAGTALVLFVFDFCLLLALPNVGDAMKEGEELIPGVLTEAFGSAGQKIFLIGALIAVMSTSIATLAAIVRTMYGMARDGQLPGSSALLKLSPRTNEPVTIIVVSALLSMVPLLVVKKIPVIIAAITALILVPYLLVLVALLARRMRGWPARAGQFDLGAWAMPATVVGIVWVVFVLLDALWPRAATNPHLGPFPIIEELGVALLVLGGLWWYGTRRGRQAAPPASPLDPESGTQASSV